MRYRRMPHDSRRAHPGAPTLTTGTLPTILLRAVAVLLTVGAAAPASGQPHDEPPARNAVAVSVGVGRHSPVGTHLGVIPDRDHVVIGIHLTAALWRTMSSRVTGTVVE